MTILFLTKFFHKSWIQKWIKNNCKIFCGIFVCQALIFTSFGKNHENHVFRVKKKVSFQTWTCFMGRKKYFSNDCFVIMFSSYPRRIAYFIYHGSQSKQSLTSTYSLSLIKKSLYYIQKSLKTIGSLSSWKTGLSQCMQGWHFVFPGFELFLLSQALSTHLILNYTSY